MTISTEKIHFNFLFKNEFEIIYKIEIILYAAYLIKRIGKPVYKRRK